MSLSSDDIVERVMEKAVSGGVQNSGTALKKFHVSQTADQLPDLRVRNAYYRTELERQIQEKREEEKQRKTRETLEDERILRKIEVEREKLRKEYFEEIERKKILQDEARRRQQMIAKRLEDLQQVETKKREEEAANRKRQILEHLYKKNESKSSSYYSYNKPWNSRDYVHSALRLSLEDVYEQAPLQILADVYRKLDFEKARMKEIIRRRISEGELYDDMNRTNK